MKKRILGIFLILGIMMFTLTGCVNRKQNVAQGNAGDTQENTNANEEYVDFNWAGEFKDDIAILTKSTNLEDTHYVIDRNFNTLFSYKENDGAEFIDGYIELADTANEDKTNIVDKNGNIVFSYDENQYRRIELVENGCLIMQEQTNTYNSSQTVEGVYSISDQKYVLGPSEEYVNKIRTYGDNMLVLNDDNTKFFNLETKSIIEYQQSISREFNDGYVVLEDNDNYQVWYLKVFDDKGNVKRIKSPYSETENEIVTGQNYTNGMVFETTGHIYEDEQTGSSNSRRLSSIFNLETGEAIDLSDKFWSITNKPEFTKDGYALVMFTNQGNMPYYTVVDKSGNMLFEPQVLNSDNTYGAMENGAPRTIKTDNLGEGNYFIVEDDGVQKVIDKDNKELITVGKNETFEEITNATVIVQWEDDSSADKRQYYKDMSGNEIKIKFGENFKEYK